MYGSFLYDANIISSDKLVMVHLLDSGNQTAAADHSDDDCPFPWQNPGAIRDSCRQVEFGLAAAFKAFESMRNQCNNEHEAQSYRLPALRQAGRMDICVALPTVLLGALQNA